MNDAKQAHPHAANMLLYAQDAATCAEPWRLWESSSAGYRWNAIEDHPKWNPMLQYRRKPPAPRTITIGKRTVNAPMTARPDGGSKYWVVNLHHPDWISESFWGVNSRITGFEHATKADAIAHGEALAEYNREACAAADALKKDYS